jgi:hypothetical protein
MKTDKPLIWGVTLSLDGGQAYFKRHTELQT